MVKQTQTSSPIWNSACAEMHQGDAAMRPQIAQRPFIITHISMSHCRKPTRLTQHTGMHSLTPGKLISLSRLKGLLLNLKTAPLPQKVTMKGGS